MHVSIHWESFSACPDNEDHCILESILRPLLIKNPQMEKCLAQLERQVLHMPLRQDFYPHSIPLPSSCTSRVLAAVRQNTVVGDPRCRPAAYL